MPTTIPTPSIIPLVSFAQAMRLKGVEAQDAHISHIKSVKHAGWTLESGKWAILISKGVKTLLYLDKLIQYDGWLKVCRPPDLDVGPDPDPPFSPPLLTVPWRGLFSS